MTTSPPPETPRQHDAGLDTPCPDANEAPRFSCGSGSLVDSPMLAWRWQLIRKHPIGGDGLRDSKSDSKTAGLPERVAREHGWSSGLTARAVEEYRRFCLLACDAGGAVSPSPAVDAVWHAHLLYTTDYWGDFCPNTLGFPLHHVPNAGKPGAAAELDRQYRRTLARYREVFGEPAPADLWPPPGTPHPRWKTIDARRYILLPRLSRPVLTALGVGAAAILALAAMGAGPAGPTPAVADLGPFDLSGRAFLMLFAGAYAVAFVMGLVIRRAGRRPTRVTPRGVRPAPYEAAMLAGGERLAVAAAAAALAGRKMVAGSGQRLSLTERTTSPAAGRHPLEAAVISALRDGPATAGTLRRRCSTPLADLRIGLVENGLLPEAGREASHRTLALLLTLGVCVAGLIKVGIGVSRDRPVSNLVLLTTLAVVVSLIAFARRIPRTTEGDRVLEQLRSFARRDDVLEEAVEGMRTVPYGTRPPPAAMPLRSAGLDPLVLGVALYGTAFLNDTPLAPLRRELEPVGAGGGSSDSSSSSDASSSSDSSGCSGSDSGTSGCGGCSGGGD